MGHRSQIYLRRNGDLVFASYYQWNYGERMVSRARWGIGYIMQFLETGYEWTFRDPEYILKMRRFFDVNFDMHDIQLSTDIMKELEELSPNRDFREDFNDFVFDAQDNNDGQLFVDIEGDKIYYAFTDCARERTIMDAEAYMAWDDGDWRNSKYISPEMKAACEANILAISEMAELMTPARLENFVHGYSDPVKPF